MNKEPSSLSLLLLILGYIAFLLTGLMIINHCYGGSLLSESRFLHWDAEHYHFISEKGYEGFRIAFFPLFPMIWKTTHLSVYGASIMNALIFLLSFTGLIKLLKISISERLLFISIPGFIFFYLPYSESIFFACSILIILGLKTNDLKWVLTGLFFATLARPAFTVFLPALIIVEYLFSAWKPALRNTLLYIAVIGCGLLIVGYIQYLDTGEWFRFFSVQKQWGNYLQIPQLPLTSWAGDYIVRLDGTAFLIGILSGLFLLGFLLKIKQFRNHQISKEVVFSMAYLGGITLSVLLFRGGSLFSLNRFVFATPFIIVVIHYWLKQSIQIRLKQLMGLIFAVIAFYTLFGSLLHFHSFIMYLLLSLYIGLLFSIKSEYSKVRNLSIIALILLNLSFQMHLFFRFLNGDWVG